LSAARSTTIQLMSFIHPTKFESINRKTSKIAKAYYTAWSKVLTLPKL
jgi:hypothetical protein